MVDHGLLEPLQSQGAFAGTSTPALGAANGAPAGGTPVGDASRSSSDRYQDAYRIATELTSGLGLRGLPLTLAVEAAGGYRELAALAPKIRAAVGEAKFARLDQALNG